MLLHVQNWTFIAQFSFQNSVLLDSVVLQNKMLLWKDPILHLFLQRDASPLPPRLAPCPTRAVAFHAVAVIHSYSTPSQVPQGFAQEQDRSPPVSSPHTTVRIIITVHTWACFGRFLESVRLWESLEILSVLSTLKPSSRFTGRKIEMVHCHYGIGKFCVLSMIQLHKPQRGVCISRITAGVYKEHAHAHGCLLNSTYFWSHHTRNTHLDTELEFTWNRM